MGSRFCVFMEFSQKCELGVSGRIVVRTAEGRASDGNDLSFSGIWKHLVVDDVRDRQLVARLRSRQIYSRSTAHCHYWHSRLSLYCMGVSLTVVHKVSFPTPGFTGLFALQNAATVVVY